MAVLSLAPATAALANGPAPTTTSVEVKLWYPEWAVSHFDQNVGVYAQSARSAGISSISLNFHAPFNFGERHPACFGLSYSPKASFGLSPGGHELAREEIELASCFQIVPRVLLANGIKLLRISRLSNSATNSVYDKELMSYSALSVLTPIADTQGKLTHWSLEGSISGGAGTSKSINDGPRAEYFSVELGVAYLVNNSARVGLTYKLETADLFLTDHEKLRDYTHGPALAVRALF